MTTANYSVVPAKFGKFPAWKLLDSTGRSCGLTTDRSLIPDMIEADQMVSLLTFNCALVGQLIENQARYQCAEDEFNDDLLV